MNFDSLSLPAPLAQALASKGYVEATQVQASVLDPAHRGRDLLVSSRTGSGKTVAFGLAMAREWLDGDGRFGPTGLPMALVVAPTRELALQVAQELTWLLGPAGGKVTTCVGGMDARREAMNLGAGTHIVVGTPGRLCDHLARKALKLADARAVVLDEADEMLDMGFREELETLLAATPETRRTLLFSATVPREIETLAGRYQRNAVRVAATPVGEAHSDIRTVVHLVSGREKELAIVNVLRQHEGTGAIVFCDTRAAVTRLEASLSERGFGTVALSGELTQSERTRALKSLRDGRAQVLVATDVAARGIDLPDVGVVIHADVPKTAEALQHRSGRTGRAGRKGSAVLIVPGGLRPAAQRLIARAHVRADWEPPPDAEAIRAREPELLGKEINEAIEALTPEDRTLAATLGATHGLENLAALLVRRLRANRPAAEELPETMAMLSRMATQPRYKEPSPTAGRGPRSSFEKHAPFAGVERERTPRTPFDPAAFVWFQLNRGRAQKADPKWLVPLICRRGGVTKADIGPIRIEDGQTKFAISVGKSAQFESQARKPDPRDPGCFIARSEGPGPRPFTRTPSEAPAASPAPAPVAAAPAPVKATRPAPIPPEVDEAPHAVRAPPSRPSPARAAPDSEGGKRPYGSRKSAPAPTRSTDAGRPFSPPKGKFGAPRAAPAGARPTTRSFDPRARSTTAAPASSAGPIWKEVAPRPTDERRKQSRTIPGGAKGTEPRDGEK